MKKALTCLLALALCAGVVGCGDRADTHTDSKPEVQKETVNEGSVEKETVETTVAKFNTQVKDNSSLNPAMDEYMTINNNQYWYGLITGVYCVVIPQEYTGDKTKDITEQTFLYVEKGAEYESDAMNYFKFLIKANHSGLSDAEVEQLIGDAKELAPNQKMANNGKGIHVGISETDEHVEYQVIRMYE